MIAGPGDPRLTDSSVQGRLFEQLLLFLDRLAGQAPVVLVIEDAHWADRSSLELLGFLIRNLRRQRVLVLLTYRSDELDRRQPLMPFLAELERSGRGERLELTRFDRSDLADLLRGILGADPDPALVRRIHERSDGNAFYAEELLASGGRGDMPDSLRDVLLAKLATLSESTLEFVRVASAGGARVSSGLVGAVMGIDQRARELALREAVERHVLVATKRADDERYGFRHALVQEAIYDELLPEERTRLHSAFAHALVDERAGQGSLRAAEIAYHWQAAHDLPHAFDAWIGAGLAAEALYAFADAQASYERALDLWDEVPDASARAPLDRVDLLVRAAHAAWFKNPAPSVAHIRSAIALVDERTDPVRAGLLHERLGAYSWSIPDPATSGAAYREAVRLVPDEPPSAARSLVLSGLGRYLTKIEHAAESRPFCERALAVANAAGAREVESGALLRLGEVLVRLGEVEQGLATIRRAVMVAVELDQIDEVANAMFGLTDALFQTGRYAQASRAIVETETYASTHGVGSRQGTLAIRLAVWMDEALGRWDEAEAALALASQFGSEAAIALELEVSKLSLDTGRGRFESADRRAQRVRIPAERFADRWAPSVLAEHALWEGRSRDAREAVRAGVGAFERAQGREEFLVTQLERLLARGLWAEAELAADARWRHDDAELAEATRLGATLIGRMRAALVDETISHLDPRQEAAWLATCEAEFTRLLDTPAPDQWATTAAAWHDLGWPYHRAYGLMREAESTLALRRDRRRAAGALTEGHAIARTLGALPLLGKIEIDRRPRGHRARRDSTSPPCKAEGSQPEAQSTRPDPARNGGARAPCSGLFRWRDREPGSS